MLRRCRLLGLSIAVGCTLSASVSSTAAAEVPFEQGRDAKDTYELNALSITHYEVTTGWLFKSTSTWWGARWGKRRIAIDDVEFFERVGRNDLAGEARNRSIGSRVLFWTGYLALVGGGLLAFSDLFDDQFGTRGYVGLAIAATGIVGLTASSIIDRQLVDEAGARQLADEHNQRLRTGLGLPTAAGLVGLRWAGRY